MIVRDRARAAAALQDAGRYAEAAEAWRSAWAAAVLEEKSTTVVAALDAKRAECAARVADRAEDYAPVDTLPAHVGECTARRVA